MKILQVVPITDTAIIPTRGTLYSASWNLYADENVVIRPTGRAMVATGICIALPNDTAGLIWRRSRLAYKYGIDVLAGVIDCDYTGPVNVVLQNHSDKSFTIQRGDRIAQLLIQPVTRINLMVVASLDDTQRGAGMLPPQSTKRTEGTERTEGTNVLVPEPKEYVSDGSTASYYELPERARELQDLISHRNMNAQDGEIFRAIYRKGLAKHSDALRDAKKVKFYADAEVERLEKLKENRNGN